MQNDAAGKKKKKGELGRVCIDLAQYASECADGETDFRTHFLKFDLHGGAQRGEVAGRVSATLKIRRDPTGALYGTAQQLSTASQSSLGRSDFDDDDISSTFEPSDDAASSNDDAAAAAGASAGDRGAAAPEAASRSARPS